MIFFSVSLGGWKDPRGFGFGAETTQNGKPEPGRRLHFGRGGGRDVPGRWGAHRWEVRLTKLSLTQRHLSCLGFKMALEVSWLKKGRQVSLSRWAVPCLTLDNCLRLPWICLEVNLSQEKLTRFLKHFLFTSGAFSAAPRTTTSPSSTPRQQGKKSCSTHWPQSDQMRWTKIKHHLVTYVLNLRWLLEFLTSKSC